ncbi:MAG TPA: hypothetical protein VEU95_10650 [Micropepsaceae bacterium]|jgi:hypothetical protein|nr:hypothetical protein [Micropepsaceae bacterium]
MSARLMVFSLAAAIAYTLAYYFDWPLFVYDLTGGELRFFATTASGPAILWYGWLMTAILAGLVATLLVPPRLIERFLPDLLWFVPAVLIVAALLYEKRWFL